MASQPAASSQPSGEVVLLTILDDNTQQNAPSSSASGANVQQQQQPPLAGLWVPLGPHYTRAMLKGVLMLLGVKPRYADRAAAGLFATVEARLRGERQPSESGGGGTAAKGGATPSPEAGGATGDSSSGQPSGEERMQQQQNRSKSAPGAPVAPAPPAAAGPGSATDRPAPAGRPPDALPAYPASVPRCDSGSTLPSIAWRVDPGPLAAERLQGPGQLRVALTRRRFEALVVACLQLAHPIGLPVQRSDLALACNLRECRSSVTVLLCGTSGTGKSTLASLTAQRLGITTVVSTDSVRHMLRGFAGPQQAPLLFVSTYQVRVGVWMGGSWSVVVC